MNITMGTTGTTGTIRSGTTRATGLSAEARRAKAETTGLPTIARSAKVGTAGLLGATLAMTALWVAVTCAAALKFDVPKGWVSKPPSTMRVAEFTLAKVTGDAEDASVTVYFFGGQGGSVQANLDRWIGQMAQPDGKPSKDVAKTSTMQTATGLKVSLVDVSGTYVAEVTPGSTERLNKPGFRQIAAVVETPDGPYFVKLTGPAGTVAKWKDSLDAFVKSLRVE